MKIFVINLAKNIERMQLIDARLCALSVDYERVDAVYGREVSVEERRQNSSPFLWWCIKGYPMRDGEYGCAMSHLNVYRKMVQDHLPITCVLEDDAVPREPLPELLDWLECHMNSDRPQIALISNHRGGAEKSDYHLERVSTGSYTDGYVITLSAAKKILEKNFPIKCPSDAWTFWQQKGWIELYQAYPEGVNQEWNTTEGYTSDVTAAGDSVIDVRQMNFVQKILWRIKRIVGLALARVLL